MRLLEDPTFWMKSKEALMRKATCQFDRESVAGQTKMLMRGSLLGYTLEITGVPTREAAMRMDVPTRLLCTNQWMAHLPEITRMAIEGAWSTGATVGIQMEHLLVFVRFLTDPTNDVVDAFLQLGFERLFGDDRNVFRSAIPPLVMPVEYMTFEEIKLAVGDES